MDVSDVSLPRRKSNANRCPSYAHALTLGQLVLFSVVVGGNPFNGTDVALLKFMKSPEWESRDNHGEIRQKRFYY